jgi:AmiR/NasT family two-component response regulator
VRQRKAQKIEKGPESRYFGLQNYLEEDRIGQYVQIAWNGSSLRFKQVQEVLLYTSGVEARQRVGQLRRDVCWIDIERRSRQVLKAKRIFLLHRPTA